MAEKLTTDLLNRAKDYLQNMNDSIAFDIAMEIQDHLTNPPRPNMEYFLSQDNSGHWVLVPQPIRAWWFKYLEFPEDDERSWVYPEGCIEVNGGPEKVVFSNFRAL